MVRHPLKKHLLCIPTIAALCVLLPSAGHADAPSFQKAGTRFNAVRTVTVAPGKPYTIVVTEFFHHGEIRSDGKNVIVTAQNKLVPMRILQVGPGDICRLAFQTIPNQSEYEIYYGGEPPTESPPPWTCHDGLLMETRRLQSCNFYSLDSVRDAFEKAEPIGADYVDAVFHGFNPMTLKNEPFLSRYTGTMHLRQAGAYGFILSSCDCSFLLIDGKLVASAPGRHGPLYRAMRGSRNDVALSAGEHSFEFYHAAGGTNAMMVVVWEVDPKNETPENVTVIPSEIFRSYLVAHLPATRLATRSARQMPDFFAKVANDIPLPDNNTPMVAVMFRDLSVKSLTMQGAKLQWDFGDGQTSRLPNVDHVYLRPGVYSVKLSIRRGSKTLEVTNRVEVDRPNAAPQENAMSFDDAVKMIETYDPKTLDAPSLRQLTLALEAKSSALANQADEAAAAVEQAENDPNRRVPTAAKDSKKDLVRNAILAESKRYLNRAVETAKSALVEKSAASGDNDLLQLARQIGPMARERLGDSATALQIWQGAGERIAANPLKAECEITAADIALNDLLKTKDAETLLEAAAKRLGANPTGAVAAKLERVRGDLAAASGDGPAAQKHYREAERLGDLGRSFVERTATRGARARSTEEFIQQKEFDRAAQELQAWQDEFPTAKIEGYWALLSARYWAGRGQHDQSVAQVEQLETVNPNSPYIDQALLLAADSEMRRGRKDRALATLHSLADNYPGSPLAPLAKKNIEAIENDQGQESGGKAGGK